TTDAFRLLIRQHRGLYECACWKCMFARGYFGFRNDTVVCTWQLIFEGMAKDCDLTFAPANPIEVPLVSLPSYRPSDAHISSGCDGDWYQEPVGIGDKLLNTKSWTEIRKYETFVH